MATNLRVNFIGQNQLSKTTAVMTRDLKVLQTRVKSVGASLDKAFAGAGLTLGVAALANGLKNATKAASDDRKAQGLLAQALQNTVGATASAIAGAEEFIRATQLETSVLDDELRPALATAVRATGSLAEGQKLLNTALNVAAGTGKDLNTVTNAISKAFNGQTGSLRKLLPSIKDGSDFMAQLDEQFANAAKTAADLDPYKRLEVVFAELQETVGVALLPALEEFTAYIVSPEGQKNIQQIVDGFVALGKAIVEANKFLIENIGFIKAIVGFLFTLRVGWGLTTGLVNAYTLATGRAVTATKLLRTALVTTGIGALLVGAGFLVESLMPKEERTKPVIPPSPTNDTLGPRTVSSTIQQIKSSGKKIKSAIQSSIDDIKKSAEDFRDSVGLAFGTFGEDENSVFNVDVLIDKMKRVVAASKGFAQNLAKLRKQGADQSLIGELTAMGPAQGNIVAQGLLQSGKLGEILKLRGSLYNTGAQANAQQAIAGNATYEININKANISAADIIKEIRMLEKKTGRKYLVGN
jgi:hypothetical protein